MSILIADDNPVNLRLLQALLQTEGHKVNVAQSGTQAAEALSKIDRSEIAILDWEMPGMTGVEVCREARKNKDLPFLYVILLTVRDSRADILTGLEAGADDYITKPFDQRELLARVRIGMRMAGLHKALQERVQEFEEALRHVRELEGIIPICGYCKKVRDDQNFWHQVEDYISRNSRAMFSHGLCPSCFENIIKPQIQKMADEKKQP